MDKPVTCYKPEWREKDVTCTVTRCIPREVVEDRTCTVLVPEFKPEKRVCTIYVKVPREVVKNVTYCKAVPVACTDPCTGCTYTTCKYETVVQPVKCIVYDCVPQPKEYTVNVCTYRPEARKYQVRYCVYDYKPETVVYKQKYCVMVPYQTTVKVPVCTPVVCAPPPPCCP